MTKGVNGLTDRRGKAKTESELTKEDRLQQENKILQAKIKDCEMEKWINRKPSKSQQINEQLVEWIKELYEEQTGILRYRQTTITINRAHKVKYNKKRLRRLMQTLHLQSLCRKKKYNYIKSTPEVTAENVLNREFYADAPNEKWLTDFTEFKYYAGVEIKKLYLITILDLYDRQIVAYKIGTSNNNQLVFETLMKP